MTMDIDITVMAKDKLGGKVIGCVYVTKRKPQHVMRKTGGSFGISEDVLKKLVACKVKYILFLYFGIRENVQFIAEINQYLNSDNTYNDNGDKQFHVRLSEMTKLRGVFNWKETVKKLNKIALGRNVETI